jgi:predicted nucleic acid-binding protein
LQIEIQNHLPKLIKLTNLDPHAVQELIDILNGKIHFILDELIPKECIKLADELTYDVDYDDIMFVALAIHLNCKLWTGDKALSNSLRLKGFNEFVTTQELLEMI